MPASYPADYIQKNRASWNARTAHHVASAFYDNEGFVAGRNSLKPLELELLGDVAGKSALHLQCHFGQDTLSLARMGANATGVDFSEAAIEQAETLNTRMGLDARFICCDLHDLPDHLHEQFDIVFTSYGTIGWLPDMDRWAGIVARYLKPGGRFVFAEFHPVYWMYDGNVKEIAYRYFQSEPIIEQEEGTYADSAAPIKTETVGWNHGLAEVVTALLGQGLSLKAMQEYDYASYNIYKDGVEVAPGRFQVRGLEGMLPLVYSLVMEK